MTDFFISYAAPDRSWAEWIAWQLESCGCSTVVQAWDFTPGSNFVAEMQRATTESARTVAILSPDFLERAFPLPEWAAAFARDPAGIERRLIPIRVRKCSPSGLLGQIVYLDLVGLGVVEARQAIRNRIIPKGLLDRSKPEAEPGYPGRESTAPVFPGKAPQRSRGLVHAAVSAGGFLDLSEVELPYLSSMDATELRPFTPSALFSFLWLPCSDYFRLSSLQRFTPCAAICTSDYVILADEFCRRLGPAEDSILRLPPSKLRTAEKELAIAAACAALDTALVASVAIPAIMLGTGRTRPALAYQTMSDLLLLPLAEVHRQRRIRRFEIRLASIGEGTHEVLKYAKRIGSSVFRRNQYSVQIIPDDRLGTTMASLTRLVAWAVGSYYNGTTDRWVRLLENAPEMNDARSSHMEEHASE